MKKFFCRSLLFAVCHVALVAVATFISASATSRAFEDGSNVPVWAGLFSGLATVLMMPFRVLWTSEFSQNLPDLIEWMLFGVNSLFWGCAIAFLVSFGRFKRQTTQKLSTST